jgi:hypothetical protein
MRKTGIELSETRCAVVQAEPAGRGARLGATGGAVRVRSFASIPYGSSSPEPLTAELRKLVAGKTVSPVAWVTVWGARSGHRFLTLPPGKPRQLEQQACREASHLGIGSHLLGKDRTVRAAVGGLRRQADGSSRRDVAVAGVSSPDVLLRLEPLRRAGFAVRGVMTPAVTLGLLARHRRGAQPGSSSAYVALDSHATALCIVRDGLAVVAREIAWGFEGERGGTRESPLPIEGLAEQLAAEIRRTFLYYRQGSKQNVSELLLCGTMPEIRALTAPLIRALDVEVETLDSLEGIDTRALPQPEDRFRAQIAGLRLAWVLSADPAPPVNLLPAVSRPERRRLQTAAWAGAAALAGLAVLFAWQRDAGPGTRVATGPAPSSAPVGVRQRTGPVEREPAVRQPAAGASAKMASEFAGQARAAPRPDAGGGSPAIQEAPKPIGEPAGAAMPPAPLPASAVAGGAAGQRHDLSGADSPAVQVAMPQPRPDAAGAESTPGAEDAGRVAGVTAGAMTPAPRDDDVPGLARKPSARPEAGKPTAVLDAESRPDEALDALVVRSILFSPDRRVALIDGRLVSEGDRVDGGIVAEIGPDAVIVQAASGARHTLALARPPFRAAR